MFQESYCSLLIITQFPVTLNDYKMAPTWRILTPSYLYSQLIIIRVHEVSGWGSSGRSGHSQGPYATQNIVLLGHLILPPRDRWKITRILGHAGSLECFWAVDSLIQFLWLIYSLLFTLIKPLCRTFLLCFSVNSDFYVSHDCQCKVIP